MTASSDPYAVLGILPGATPQEVQRAFRDLVRKHHPDTAMGHGDPEQLRAVLAAYGALRSPPHATDLDLRPAGAQSQHAVRRPPYMTGYQPQPGSGWLRERPPATPMPPIWAGPVRWHGKTQ